MGALFAQTFDRSQPIYVDLRQFTSISQPIYVDLRQFTSICIDLRRFMLIYVDLRQFTSMDRGGVTTLEYPGVPLAAAYIYIYIYIYSPNKGGTTE